MIVQHKLTAAPAAVAHSLCLERGGASHTFDHASNRHASAVLPCPNSVRFQGGWECLSVRTAARRDPCDYTQPHPLPFVAVAGGTSMLITEPETMTTRNAGKPGTAAPSSYVPSHYLRRLARSIVLRAALRGRISWHAALALLSTINGQEG